MLLFYSAAMMLWATRPWIDTQALVTPPGEPAAFAEFRCPSVFSGAVPADPDPVEEPAFPLSHRPCDEQTSRRVLFVADLAAAAAAMVLLQRASARYRAAATAGEPLDTELPAPA